MRRTAETRTLTLRMPAALHVAAVAVAARNQVSVNALMQDALESFLHAEEERALYDSFSRLGEDPAECNVEFAWPAQREAIERVDRS